MMRVPTRFDVRHVAYVVHNGNALYRRTLTENGLDSACLRLPRPCGPARCSVAAISEKKFSDPPSSEGRKGVLTCVRVEIPISENRLASCTPPFRTFPGVRYGRAQHRNFPNRRYGRMHVHGTRRTPCSRRGVLGAERMATRIGGGAGGTCG